MSKLHEISTLLDKSGRTAVAVLLTRRDYSDIVNDKWFGGHHITHIMEVPVVQADVQHSYFISVDYTGQPVLQQIPL